MLKQTNITAVEKHVWLQKIQSNLLTDIIMVCVSMCVKESSGSQSTSQMVRDVIQSILTNGILLWKEGLFLKDILNSTSSSELLEEKSTMLVQSEPEERPTLITWCEHAAMHEESNVK